jgi:hypothetical protein
MCHETYVIITSYIRKQKLCAREFEMIQLSDMFSKKLNITTPSVAERDLKNVSGISWRDVVKILRLRIYIELHLPWYTIHNTAHVYNKGCAVKVATNIQRATSKASMQATSVLARKVWLTS